MRTRTTPIAATRRVHGEPWPIIERFVDRPRSFLPPPAHRLRDGRWRTGVHAGRLRHEVVIAVGDVVTEADGWARPIDWTPTRGAIHRRVGNALLPNFSGRVALRQRGEACVVEIVGSYRPPLGRVGRFLDAWRLHGVAQRTVEQVADELASRLAVGDGDASGPRPLGGPGPGRSERPR